MPKAGANILLVEDNPGDVRLTCEALRETEYRCNVHVIEDGEQALAYLTRDGADTAVQRPYLFFSI